ncbi:MAG: PAS domain-containing sensor histidine kinase [Anaerolineae bacterium]|nr:PAS domain-containing sensor histidine kinase [Anaerolineae bacterium]
MAVDDNVLARLNTGTDYYQLVVELTGDVVFMADVGTRYTYFTANVMSLYGYTPAELTGQPLTSVVHPHWRDRANAFYNDQLRERIPETTLELPVITTKGETLWVRMMVRLMVEEDRAAGYFGVVRDITTHKRSVEEWDYHIQQLDILRQVNDELMYTLNMPYVLSVALDAAVRLTGADAGAINLIEDKGVRTVQIIGAFPPKLLDTYLSPEVGIVGRVLRSGQGELILDVNHDPDYITQVPGMQAQLSVPLISQNRPIGVICILTRRPERFTQDSFELVTMLASRVAVAMDNAQLYQWSQDQLAELQALYSRVQGLEQLKTDMIRIAAHDLRNPLTNIVSAAYILETTLGDQPTDIQKETLAAIEQAVKRMKKITTDILSMERIEQLAKQSVLDTVNLRLLMEQVYLEYEPQASEKGLTFTMVDGESPVKVRGDGAQLYEVIANLVSNAIKYTPVGGTVNLSLKTANNKAVLEVRDTGYGIPDALQARLFQPFFRAQTKETDTIEGTGLGLHLVKNIIERHGGKMRFHSTYGEGSTFGFEMGSV